MKKKIFWSIFVVSMLTLALSIGFVTSLIYKDSSRKIQEEVKSETLFLQEILLRQGYEADDAVEYLKEAGIKSSNRITLIAKDGTVLYDNHAASQSMENHLNRPEIQDALEIGSGEDLRASETLGRQTYYYAVLVANNYILRLSDTNQSFWGVMGSAVDTVFYICLLAAVVAIITAVILTNSIVDPINHINLERPLTNNTYDELSPLLRSLEGKNRDIQKKIEVIEKNKKEFEFITVNMKEGLVLLNSQGNLLFINKKAEEILDKNMTGSYLTLCRNENYISAVESALNGEAKDVIFEKKGRDYHIFANPVEQAENGEGCSAVLFIMDVTQDYQAEKMRREFSANVSHELKTPLTSIMGAAEIMENGLVKKEDIPSFAGRIRRESRRMLSLIEDIIKISRLDEGDLKSQFEPVDLESVCHSVVQQLEDKALAARVTLSFESTYANTTEKPIIQGVAQVVSEMVFNLCDNAITYNKEGGSVRLFLTRQADRPILTVSDTGIGIPAESQARVFERFYRVDKSHSKKTGGTGLGLSIVKHGAMLHDAKVELTSIEGEGTTITLAF